MIQSKLTLYQEKKLPRRAIKTDYSTYWVYPTIKYDDRCGNGHNTFTITCAIRDTKGIWDSYGCCHEKFAQFYPEYAHLIKWHLCSSDGPLYYIENTLYHASKGNFESARATAIWQDATDEELSLPSEVLKVRLLQRLPKLMEEFRRDVESLGFVY